MSELKKTYWKSLAERDALMDPTIAPPPDMPEAGIMDAGFVQGLATLAEDAAGLRLDRGAFLKLAGFSLAGGFVTAADLGWVLTAPGLVSYSVWNLLVFLMAIFFLLSLRKRLAAI